MNAKTNIIHGDNREVLKGFAENSFHAIVTDPPYHLTTNKKGGSGPASVNLNTPHGRARITTGFMGKAWDGGDIAFDPEFWRECLRVLKPGGYLLSFGGSRTYHRMACAIEDAGFEIRDMIEWLYGSGFPKSMDVSKAMDKKAGATREVVGPPPYKRGKPTQSYSATRKVSYDCQPQPITQPSTINAQLWSGYGTALKPAHEPICVARKPLDGTVVENVLKWGCGAVNIDGCRVNVPSAGCQVSGSDRRIGSPGWGGPNKRLSGAPGQEGKLVPRTPPADGGRFPANLLLDSEAAELLDGQSGECPAGVEPLKRASNNVFGVTSGGNVIDRPSSTGGASRYFQRCDFTEEERALNLQFALRFFYTAKASGSERGHQTKAALPLFGIAEEEFRNTHPTVKPLALMRYLLRLVVPGAGCQVSGEGAQVLDPFIGSGTTALACRELGFDCTGIELEAEHVAIIKERLGRKI